MFMRSNEKERGGERYAKEVGDQNAGMAEGEGSPGAEVVATSYSVGLEITKIFRVDSQLIDEQDIRYW